ncbi:MAG: hypothetical protein KatS3mg059_1414 [Thermomicrobiales bacterium]|nr:MAG: hypothetical protein KatS3mg059_1414 [Thermomicrobiales bacterium]
MSFTARATSLTFADFPVHEVGKRAAGLAVRLIQRLAIDGAALTGRRQTRVARVMIGSELSATTGSRSRSPQPRQALPRGCSHAVRNRHASIRNPPHA